MTIHYIAIDLLKIKISECKKLCRDNDIKLYDNDKRIKTEDLSKLRTANG